MAISRITSQDASASSGSATSITATYAATPTQGNLLVASGYSNGGFAGINTSSTGWTNNASIIDSGTSTHNLFIWYKIAGASESTSFVLTSGIAGACALRAQIFEYQGTNKSNQLANPSGTFFGTDTAANTTLTSNTITTTNDNNLLFAGIGWSGNINSGSASFSNSNLTVLTANQRMTTADLVVSSAGSYSTTCTWTNTTNRIGVMCLVGFTQAPSSTVWSPVSLKGVG